MAEPRLVPWVKVRTAIAAACRAANESPDHHRALVRAVRDEPPADWWWFLDYFEARVAAFESIKFRAAA